jgi:type I restriction enzyme, S subunit
MSAGTPDGWIQVALGDIATVSAGIGFPNEYQGLKSGDVPFFKVSDVSRAVLSSRGNLFQANNYVSVEVVELLRGNLLKPGTTVFAKIGEAIKLNRRAIVRTPCLVDNNVMAVKSHIDEMDYYVNYFLKTVEFSGQSRATTVPSLRKGDVENLSLPLPPKNEQSRIADKLDTVLTRVDACRDRLARVAPLLKRFRQSVLAAATSGRLTEGWRGAEQQTKWRKRLLGDFLEIRNGKAFPSSAYQEAGVKLLRPGNLAVSGFVQWGELNTTYLDASYIHGNEDFVLGKDSLVMNLTAQSLKDDFLGRVCWMNCDEPVLLNQRICSFNIKTVDVQKKYLYYFFRSPIFRSYVDTLDTGSLIKHMYSRQLIGYELSVPPVHEQTEIVRRVETLFAFADRLEARLKTAQTAADRLTPALLAKAFRGELVPQDPNDEPAAELLKRLAASRDAAPKAKRGRRSATADTTP